MKRSSALKRTGPPPRHTRLSAVSARRRRQQRVRRKRMLAAFGTDPVCQVRWEGVCTGMADDAHEPGMRSRGADPTDPAQAVPCCRACHDRIHTDVAEATRRGWLVASWEARTA